MVFYPAWLQLFGTYQTGTNILQVEKHFYRLNMIKSSNLCLVVLSDHNSWTPGPICFNFWLGNSIEPRECYKWRGLTYVGKNSRQSWVSKLVFKVCIKVAVFGQVSASGSGFFILLFLLFFCFILFENSHWWKNDKSSLQNMHFFAENIMLSKSNSNNFVLARKSLLIIYIFVAVR